MDLPDSIYLHGINLLPEFGPARIAKLTRHYKTFAQAFHATGAAIKNTGLEDSLVKRFLAFRAKLNLHQEYAALVKNGISLITLRDPNYPKLLLEIAKPPPLLYYRGVMNEPDELCLAVVGTRKITNYGKTVIPELISPLVDSGATVVSGMALGIDYEAHRVAINKGRRTVAVLGGGLDDMTIYPRHHVLLAKQIIDQGGALVSEYPIGTPSFKQNFIARNRIIAGMAVATVVVECGLKSGTLITAKYALEQNRSVYAVPGPIYSPQSLGPNNLIKMGAKPMTSASDVLEDLNLTNLARQVEMQKQFGDSKEETAILSLLSFEPVIINELIKKSCLEASVVISTLTFLEMKGKIRNLGGQQYILSR